MNILPFVSVVIPVYNTEKYLAECIESVLAQTYKNIEIVLVDDGSTDSCGKICDNYAKSQSNITVIHQKNSGLSVARNTGMQYVSNSKSTWVTFLDSDDTIASTMVETLLSAALHYNAKLAICSLCYMSFGSNGKLTPIDSQRSDDSICSITSHTIINRLWNSEYDNSVFTASTAKLFYVPFFMPMIHYTPGIICEDDNLANTLYLDNYPVAMVNKSMYNWRMNPSSISHSPFSSKRCIMLKILYERQTILKNYGFSISASKTAKVFCELYIEYYFKAVKAGRPDWVLKYNQYYRKMQKACGLKNMLKHRIRYTIFNISPKLYHNLILLKRNCNK